MEIGPGRWDDIAALFGETGASNGCWCMWWRLSNQEFAAGDGNRAALRSLVDAGEQVGLVAHADGGPIGWCAVAPRPSYGRLPRTRALNLTGLDDPTVWSVVCFFVKREHRRSGVASTLLDAAVDLARERGAAVVESYPVQGKANNPAMATGTVDLYAKAGFVMHAPREGRRGVMRLTL